MKNRATLHVMSVTTGSAERDPNNMEKSILSILVGLGSITIAVFNRDFYWRKGWFSGEKPAPRWAGQSLFGLVGAALIVYGFAHLIAD